MQETAQSSNATSFVEDSASRRDSNYTLSPGSAKREEREVKTEAVQPSLIEEDPPEQSRRQGRKGRAPQPKLRPKGTKKVYLYSLPEDFALLEQLFAFREAQLLLPALTRNEFFLELAHRLLRGLPSVLNRVEKLEQNGELPLFIVYFFCRQFPEHCGERRLFVSRRSDEMRVTMKDNPLPQIPQAEQQFVEFVQQSVQHPTASHVRALQALLKRAQQAETRGANDSLLRSVALAHYIESALAARVDSRAAASPAKPPPALQEVPSSSSEPAEAEKQQRQASTSKDRASPHLQRLPTPRSPHPVLQPAAPSEASPVKAQLLITHSLSTNERFLVDFLLGKICSAFDLDREELLRSIGVSL